MVINRIWVQKGSCGIIDPALEGCVVSQDFPTFEINLSSISPDWLRYMFRAEWFWKECKSKSRGTSGRERIDPEEYLDIDIPLPALDDQHRIVAKINAIQSRLVEANVLQEATDANIYGLLSVAHHRITQGVALQPMAEVAPLIRRAVNIQADQEYPELGIRSFGKGTFHKPAIRGADLNGKRIYHIEPGDLLFSNVFAWEGAVAIVKPEDRGRYGSHRFITRLPKEGTVTAQFLRFHFLTEDGLQQLRDASPGSAGRNRTLGLKALDAIKVPIPPYEAQLWFDRLYGKLDALRSRQTEVEQEIESLMPSILDKLFRGEL